MEKYIEQIERDPMKSSLLVVLILFCIGCMDSNQPITLKITLNNNKSASIDASSQRVKKIVESVSILLDLKTIEIKNEKSLITITGDDSELPKLKEVFARGFKSGYLYNSFARTEFINILHTLDSIALGSSNNLFSLNPNDNLKPSKLLTVGDQLEVIVEKKDFTALDSVVQNANTQKAFLGSPNRTIGLFIIDSLIQYNTGYYKIAFVNKSVKPLGNNVTKFSLSHKPLLIEDYMEPDLGSFFPKCSNTSQSELPTCLTKHYDENKVLEVWNEISKEPAIKDTCYFTPEFPVVKIHFADTVVIDSTLYSSFSTFFPLLGKPQKILPLSNTLSQEYSVCKKRGVFPEDDSLMDGMEPIRLLYPSKIIELNSVIMHSEKALLSYNAKVSKNLLNKEAYLTVLLSLIPDYVTVVVE